MYISNSLPLLIEASLIDEQYDWFRIDKTSKNPTEYNSTVKHKYLLSGSIRDYGNPIKISLTLNRIIDEYESTSIYSQTVEVLKNNLLMDVDKLSKNIAKAIENDIKNLNKVKQLSLLIYTFESKIDNVDENEYGNYIADYFLFDLEYEPYLTGVEKYVRQKQIAGPVHTANLGPAVRGAKHMP